MCCFIGADELVCSSKVSKQFRMLHNEELNGLCICDIFRIVKIQETVMSLAYSYYGKSNAYMILRVHLLESVCLEG